MPITFYNEYEALQIPSGTNGADGLSAVSTVKDSTTTIPASGSTTTLFASGVGIYGFEWLKAGVFFNMPGYGTYEVISEGAPTATEKQITYRNNGAAGNIPTTVVPINTLIVPAGPPGGNGTNGTAVLNGTVNPLNNQGNNGDFYIRTDTNTIFGPKNAGVWPAGVGLTGPAGPTGASGTSLIRVGKWSPTLPLLNNDFLDVSNGIGVGLASGELAPYSKLKITYYGYFRVTTVNTDARNPEADIIFFSPTLDIGPGGIYAMDPSTIEFNLEYNYPTGFYVEVFARKSNTTLPNRVDYKVEFEFIKTASNEAVSNLSVTTWGTWGNAAQRKVMNASRTWAFTWATGAFYFRPFLFRADKATGFAVDVSSVAHTTELFKLI